VVQGLYFGDFVSLKGFLDDFVECERTKGDKDFRKIPRLMMKTYAYHIPLQIQISLPLVLVLLRLV